MTPPTTAAVAPSLHWLLITRSCRETRMIPNPERTTEGISSSQGLSRRQALKLGALVALGMMLPVATNITPTATGVKQSPRVPLFSRNLRIPPALAPTSSHATTDYHKMTQQEALLEILPVP